MLPWKTMIWLISFFSRTPFWVLLCSGFYTFYIPGVSTSSSSYSGSQSLYSGLFTFISFIFQVPNSEQFFWVLRLYILGSLPIYSWFYTFTFRVLNLFNPVFYLYILGSLPIYSWFYTFTFRVLNLFIPVLFTFIFWVFNTRSIPDSTSWSWTTSRVLY